MQKFLGIFIIFACVVGGFLMSGGRLASFWQPGEIIIILGAGLGAMVLANPKPVLAEMYRQFRGIMRKNEYTDEYQRQLLMLLFELLELVQDGGLKVLDEHIEVPESSPLFQKYPLILQNKAIITFIADNFRLMAMGKINEHELEGILEQELVAMEENLLQPSRSLQRTAEAMPGFGICAAVLGIIITMQSIDGSIAVIRRQSGGGAGRHLPRRVLLLLPDGSRGERHGAADQEADGGYRVRAYRAGQPRGR
ncbi:flagellar motor protein MotA [Enterobacter cancerogenus]|uniref:Flagellar motor protein MotA n=1 Tax=Enterobacter cancerogenus TaxID=69218 RepID=A0A484XTY4_9ENTR|nr:flagellar motor protein MotA [Enterobacter cancerogenus]